MKRRDFLGITLGTLTASQIAFPAIWMPKLWTPQQLKLRLALNTSEGKIWAPNTIKSNSLSACFITERMTWQYDDKLEIYDAEIYIGKELLRKNLTVNLTAKKGQEIEFSVLDFLSIQKRKLAESWGLDWEKKFLF